MFSSFIFQLLFCFCLSALIIAEKWPLNICYAADFYNDKSPEPTDPYFNSNEEKPFAPQPEDKATEARTCSGCDKNSSDKIKMIAKPLTPYIEEPRSYSNTHCVDNERKPLPNTGFNALLSRAKLSRSCPTALKKLACINSPWRNLNLEERAHELLTQAIPITQYYLDNNDGRKYIIDPRAMLCVAAIETTSLEPLSKNPSKCRKNGDSSAQGMGQMTFSTLNSYVKKGFQSKIPPFNQAPYSGSSELLFDALANSVPLQLEVMAFTLFIKKKKGLLNDYRMFLRYHSKSNSYASAATKCTECLQKVLPDLHNNLTDTAIGCLSHTVRVRKKGRKYSSFSGSENPDLIKRSFNSYSNQCKKWSDPKTDNSMLCRE